MNHPILDIRKIRTYYGDSYILQDVSISVPQGKVVALLGRNGVGKTTTIKSIIGLKPPKQGDIFFKEKEITHLPTYNIARMGISLVPQGRGIFESLTVLEHLTVFSNKKTGNYWNLERIFSIFPRLKDRLKHKGSALSGGEQQMVAISRALLTNPDLILMDEPTEGLSPLIVEEVADVIKYLKKEAKLSVFLVEQKLNFALKLADYIYIMNKGNIVFHGMVEELLNSPEIKLTYLGI